MEEKGTKSVKQNMIWNTAGSLIYYFCQWLMSVLIVRISGFADAGILSLALSVTAAPAIVGLFNIRSYQVSDIEGQYSDEVYIRSRIYTSVLAYLTCIGVVLINGYPMKKAVVILMFMFFKISEGFADVYYGIDQKRERMDYAGISLSVRGIGTLILFFGVFLLTENLLLSIVAMTIFSFLVVFLYDRKVAGVKKEREEKRANIATLVKSLLWVCFPLAVVAFLNNLSISVPRLFLERYYGEEIMGIYSSVSSPTTVIQLAAMTLFAPLIPPLTAEYHKRNKKNFMKMIGQFFLLIAVLTMICLIGGKLFARWGLVLLFGAEIEPYVYLFFPVVLIAVLIALNASLFSICTLMREIKTQYLIGFAGIIGALLLSVTEVKTDSMIGVNWAMIGTLLIQIVIQLGLIGKNLKNM
ncbi:MAG: oligosaccharide flippase family protein [Lachnospiraceae bacterium]|nr:oligosaccharide flippase family protein [Lachnospiraceae bacterium]